MGILDFFGGGSDKPAVDPSMAAMRDLGMPQSLIDAYGAEQEKNRKMQAMQMIIGGIGNAVSGYQGMAPVAAPNLGASGGGGGGDISGSMDGLLDRAMKFSKLQEGVRQQQQMAQIRQTISSDTRLNDVERKAFLTNPEAYLKLVESDVARRSGPGDIEIKYDGDGRPVAAFNKQTQKMLTPDELAGRNITLASGLSQNKAWEMEDNLRKEYTGAGETKRYIEADPIYRSMVKSATNDTGAADLDLVYGIGKIMDPGSVVREGEMVMVNRSSPFAEMLQGYIGSIQGQGKLTPETRARLIEMARTRMGELRTAHDEITGGITARAKERNIDPSRVLSRKYDELPDAPLWSGKENMWLPMEAIQSLRSNPSPERQQTFDEKFGAGMSARILRGR
jgi:hypothetical protein